MNPIEHDDFAATPDKKIEQTIGLLKAEIEKLKTENQQLKQKAIHLLNYDTEIMPLKEIITFMPGNMFWKNKQGYYLGCNNNLAKLLGLNSPAEIVGKRLEDFNYIHPFSDLEALNQVDQSIMESKKGQFLEEIGVNEHNEPAIYYSQKIPLLDSIGEVIGLLGISIDITQQKKMAEDLKLAKQKAEASNHAKSQFLAVVNHELRTPLSCIVGLIELLKKEIHPNQEIKKLIYAIENSTQHLLNLVNDVLDFSRLETGKYNLHITPVHLSSTLSEVYQLLKPLAEKKKLKLKIHLHETCPQYLLTDGRILQQILINLINNAIKFTEKGYVLVDLLVIKQQKQHAFIEIKVKDTGPGIPKDKLNLIFEPFQQLEDAYTRQSSRSGTGLGLTIVEKLAELIGCKIKVSSNIGTGSIFSLIGEFDIQNQAPIKKTKIKNINNKNELKHPSLQFKKPPRILLVEDDPTIQYIHKKMLLDLGCVVDIAANGKTAIQLLNEHQLLFVDLILPDIICF